MALTVSSSVTSPERKVLVIGENSYHLLSKDSVERRTILASIANSDLLEEGENNSCVHGLIGDSEVDSISLGNIVDRVSKRKTRQDGQCWIGEELEKTITIKAARRVTSNHYFGALHLHYASNQMPLRTLHVHNSYGCGVQCVR